MNDATPRLTVWFNPECTVGDMLAALESYGVELTRNGKVLERVPIQFIVIERPFFATLPSPADAWRRHLCTRSDNPIIPGWADHLSFGIDKSLELRLIRFTPYREEGEPELTRWPFWVDQPLEIAFQFGDQWWSFKFSPGKTYEDRAMETPPE